MSDDAEDQLIVRDPVVFMNTIFDDICEQAAEDYVPTASDLAWMQTQKVRIQARLAELRRLLPKAPIELTLLSDAPTIPGGVAIPLEIQALNRCALIAQLERLQAEHHLRFAHGGLTTASENDLRTTLVLALQMIAEKTRR